MTRAKGAAAPFSFPHFSLASPLQRDDALLANALGALHDGYFADALIAAEYVCRRHPGRVIPAILRARIMEKCRPELVAKAWYQAWVCDPENPTVQDNLLRSWLDANALQAARELGVAFLPVRCRSGNQDSLLDLLRCTGVARVGACWAANGRIEGRVFQFADVDLPVRLMLSEQDGQTWMEVVPRDGHFSIACPRPAGVFSLAFADNAGTGITSSGKSILQGSPLVFSASKPYSNRTQSPVLPKRSNLGMAAKRPVALDIVIPVYRGYAQVKACIDSVLTSLSWNQAKAGLIVIDDASPEPALSAWLDHLADEGKITLLRNAYNLGFIETTNRGMRQHPAHDVLLLNADTLVHGDWIDRLQQCLYRSDDIASVTPWSNNGEITSFPTIALAAAMPDLQQLAELDQQATALRDAAITDDIVLPACCGFSMLMRRSVIDQIGMLDGVGLRRGYGEEVDWCLRARAAGYRHLAATGVFVAHAGGVSFGFEKMLRVKQNRAVLQARYPDYYPEYQQFLQSDPLASARKALRAALQPASQRAASAWLRNVDAVQDKTKQTTAGIHVAIPAALPSSCVRIAVWRHDLTAPHAAKVLALARALARSQQPVRLLILGKVSDALWHTGVVDAMPPEYSTNVNATVSFFSDATLLGLSNCQMVLIAPGQLPPASLPFCVLDQNFEPATWLTALLTEWQAAWQAPLQERLQQVAQYA
jgi:GT2 family glycosyltransferase